MTLLRELEEMINHYAPHRTLKDIISEVITERDLPNDPVFYLEIQNAIGNHYIRRVEAKQNAEEMERLEGGLDEADTGKGD